MLGMLANSKSQNMIEHDSRSCILRILGHDSTWPNPPDPHNDWSHLLWPGILASLAWLFFPRASERRVLPIVGVCQASSHLLIFTSSHLHIFSSSHLLFFTSSHFHTLTSSHPQIFTSSNLHIFSSSHLSHSLLPCCSLAILLSPSISLLKARGSANETARNATLSHEMTFDRQKLK